MSRQNLRCTWIYEWTEFFQINSLGQSLVFSFNILIFFRWYRVNFHFSFCIILFILSQNDGGKIREECSRYQTNRLIVYCKLQKVGVHFSIWGTILKGCFSSYFTCKTTIYLIALKNLNLIIWFRKTFKDYFLAIEINMIPYILMLFFRL